MSIPDVRSLTESFASYVNSIGSQKPEVSFESSLSVQKISTRGRLVIQPLSLSLNTQLRGKGIHDVDIDIVSLTKLSSKDDTQVFPILENMIQIYSELSKSIRDTNVIPGYRLSDLQFGDDGSLYDRDVLDSYSVLRSSLECTLTQTDIT